MTDTTNDGWERRVLARPLIQGGIRREPGETVALRVDQIARLEREGYFAEAAKAPKTRGKATRTGKRKTEGGNNEA